MNPKPPLGARRGRWIAALSSVMTAATASAQFRVPETLSPEQAARFERFESFQIKGVCGVRDLDRLSSFGVNTVRGYTTRSASEALETLDRAHSLGMKVIVSEWMPHHGENTGNNGSTWNFDYTVRGEQMVRNLIEKIEGVGDHPALLMWGLGNEVHLDEPYLRTVNWMSEEIHARFPHHLTSLTMVNAKPEAIEAVQRFAPDLDVLGIQSYSMGAVRNAIRSTEEHWGKPFYVSEFNGKGPWNFGKTEWGEALDEPVSVKVGDIAACYDAIDASPLCLGSTIFVWGYFRNNRPTYFSMLLDPHPDGTADTDGLLMTPQGEAMVERFKPTHTFDNRAPVLTRIETADGARFAAAEAGAEVALRLEATDADGDPVRYECWVLDSKPDRPKTVSGPFRSDGSGGATLTVPDRVGRYLIMAYAHDDRGGASASTLPLEVR